MGWFSKETQEKRFEILLQFTHWEGQTLLDVGCGLGDLYHYIKVHTFPIHYTGIDQTPLHTHYAKMAYPGGTFLTKHILNWTQQVDVCLASGLFNLRDHNNNEWIQFENILRKMIAVSKQGVAFNLLNPQEIHTNDLVSYNKEKVMALCQSLSKKVIEAPPYLANDYTLFLYKNP